MTFQVNKSSSNFWNSLKLTWQKCADLPDIVWVTSIAVLDRNFYVSAKTATGAFHEPLMYDSNKDRWYTLPALPYCNFNLVAVPDRKQLLAIGGNYGITECSNKVFLWDKENNKWTTPYPNMPTARCCCSSISHGSTVIVAGGMKCWDPWTLTRAVEVLYIKEHSLFSRSHWSVVEQLPFIVTNAVPLIVNDKLYVTVGHNAEIGINSCDIVTASLPELLQSSNNKTSSSQVWHKLPDIPYTSFSISHCRGRLIIFSGFHKIEHSIEEKPVLLSVPLIHIYNDLTNTWDCVGKIPCDYLLGRSVCVRDNKIYFIGGLTGTYSAGKDNDIVATCYMLTLSP